MRRAPPGRVRRDRRRRRRSRRSRVATALVTPFPPQLIAAVAQLDRLVHAGRGARRDDCPARDDLIPAARRPRRSDCRANPAPAVQAPLRSAHSRLLGLVVVASCSSSGSAVQSFAIGRGKLDRAVDAGAEALGRGPDLELGIDVQTTRDVDGREEDITELRRDPRIRLDLGRGIGLRAAPRAARAPRPRSRRGAPARSGYSNPADRARCCTLRAYESPGRFSGTSWKTPRGPPRSRLIRPSSGAPRRRSHLSVAENVRCRATSFA